MPGSDPWNPCQVYMEDAGKGGSNPVWVEQGMMTPVNPFLIDNTAGLGENKRPRSPKDDDTLGAVENVFRYLLDEEAPVLLAENKRLRSLGDDDIHRMSLHETPEAVQQVFRYLLDEEAPADWSCTAEEEENFKATYNWMFELHNNIKKAHMSDFHIWNALHIDRHVLGEWIRRYNNKDRGIKFRKAAFYLKVAIIKWKNNGRKWQPQSLDEWVTEQDKKWAPHQGDSVYKYPWSVAAEKDVEEISKLLQRVRDDFNQRRANSIQDCYALRIDKHVLSEWKKRRDEGDRFIMFRKASSYIRSAITKWQRKKDNRIIVQPQTLDEWVAEQDEKNREPGYVKEKTEEGDIIFVRETDKKRFMYAPMDPAFIAAAQQASRGAGGAARA